MGAQYDPVALKQEWLQLAERTRPEIERAIAAGIEPGLTFLRHDGSVGWFDDAGSQPHRASLGGATPRISGVGDV
jgi:hypothetical protein